jgi:hypothetical protein
LSSSEEGNGVPHISHLNPPISDDALLAAVSAGPGGDVFDDAIYIASWFDMIYNS